MKLTLYENNNQKNLLLNMICHIVSTVSVDLWFYVCYLPMIGHSAIKTLVVGYDASVFLLAVCQTPHTVIEAFLAG